MHVSLVKSTLTKLVWSVEHPDSNFTVTEYIGSWDDEKPGTVTISDDYPNSVNIPGNLGTALLLINDRGIEATL